VTPSVTASGDTNLSDATGKEERREGRGRKGRELGLGE